MKYVKLSENLEISRITHGMRRLNEWNLTPQEKLTMIKEDLDLGITTFDHADIYGNYSCEETFGEAIKLEPSIRKDIKLISKCGIKLVCDKYPSRRINYYDTSKNYIMQSVNQSLKNLHTDYLDLLLIHRPDPFINPDEVSEAFNNLKQTGKVLNFGVSNFNASQFESLQNNLDMKLVTNQVEISPLTLDYFSNGTMDQCVKQQIAPMAWSPLAGGRLFHANDETSIRVQNKLKEIAIRYQVSIDEMIYAWLLTHPSNISPIIGSGKPSRLKKAVNALGLPLTREEWFEIYVSSLGKDVD